MIPAAAQDITWTPDAAYRYCQRLAQTHYENFTVGSWLLPRSKRRHVHAIYGYCRTVDDLGDEAAPPTVPALAGGREVAIDESAPAYRLRLLGWWQTELEACYAGTPTHPVMVALRETIQTFGIPRDPFLKLIEANRLDQRDQRYPTFDDLLYYCDRSANPVGHLFLYLFGYRDAEHQHLSDVTCTALQLANFWQDVARDYRKGRVYLPLEDLTRFGYSEAELARGVENDAFRQLLSFEVDRAMSLFREGADLVNHLEGPVKLDVALFTRGGVAVLEAIRRQDYNVLTNRPRLSRRRKAGLFLSTWLSWKLGLGLGLPAPFPGEARP
ncbi:MAG TPA: squalene synthase HpnC [Dehalococcoidia bacterium]|nr:squalene synthase HpnC [Dehalococcoidia bacterium]